MDEKTEELRDIFTTVTDGADTVTERQEDSRGSLEGDDRSVEERLQGLVEQMRERYEFDTQLDDDALVTVARRHYEEEDDAAVAAELGVSERDVFEARLALHLVSDGDRDEAVLEALAEGETPDVSEDHLERQRLVAAADERSLTANHRYRDEFDALLADADISQRMASDLREDGLEDATEGMETDVSF